MYVQILSKQGRDTKWLTIHKFTDKPHPMHVEYSINKAVLILYSTCTCSWYGIIVGVINCTTCILRLLYGDILLTYTVYCTCMHIPDQELKPLKCQKYHHLLED